jgi:LacI family transcriptional regulator
MDDLSRFCCLNSRCPDHGVRGGENLSVCGHYGKGDSIRFLRCRSCGGRFSERKGPPLFRSHLPPEKATAVLEHVAEGRGARQTERLVGVHRDTVTRSSRKAGGHAPAARDELVAVSPPDAPGPVR